MSFREDEVIFDQGEKAALLFIVIDGAVRIRKTDSEGRASVIAELVAGDAIGELELLNGAPWNATFGRLRRAPDGWRSTGRQSPSVC